MPIRNYVVTGVTLLAMLFAISSHSAWWSFSKDDESATSDLEAVEITWEDLIPDDFTPPINPFESMSQAEIDKLMDGSDESNAKMAELQKAFNYSPVVSELDGKRVKLPAYITPLEFDGDSMRMKEFLLVPYVGACIHVPPPPANQVVHAQSPEAVELPNMYDPIWAVGVIRAETVKSDLAESGYRIEIEQVQPYTQR